MPNADDFILAAPNRMPPLPRGAGVSTEAVQFPGKYVETTTKDGRKMCQRKQCSSQASVNRFSMTSTSLSIDSVCEEEKFPSETRKRHTRAILKNEARILGKVILDTWRFILGYIAKYRWILFRGSFLLSDSLLLCVFS